MEFYSKELKKIMNSEDVYALRVCRPTYDFLYELRRKLKEKNNDIYFSLSKDSSFYIDMGKYLREDYLIYLIERYVDNNEYFVLAKTTGSCRYMEEILSGIKIPIIHVDITIKHNGIVYTKVNLNNNMNKFPPFYIPIYEIKYYSDINNRKKDTIFYLTIDDSQYLYSFANGNGLIKNIGFLLEEANLSLRSEDEIKKISNIYKECQDYSHNIPVSNFIGESEKYIYEFQEMLKKIEEKDKKLILQTQKEKQDKLKIENEAQILKYQEDKRKKELILSLRNARF